MRRCPSGGVDETGHSIDLHVGHLRSETVAAKLAESIEANSTHAVGIGVCQY
jgi:hypothetical protein